MRIAAQRAIWRSRCTRSDPRRCWSSARVDVEAVPAVPAVQMLDTWKSVHWIASHRGRRGSAGQWSVR